MVTIENKGNPVTRVPNIDKAVCISNPATTSERCTNLKYSQTGNGKIEGQSRLFNYGIATG